MSKLSILFSFKGRIPRSQFWGLFYALILLSFIIAFPFAFYDSAMKTLSIGGIDILGVIGFLVFVLFIVIITATTVKRFHDRDKSGWWSIIALIPYLGILWILIECGFMKGTVGTNKYGEDPVYRKEPIVS